MTYLDCMEGTCIHAAHNAEWAQAVRGILGSGVSRKAGRSARKRSDRLTGTDSPASLTQTLSLPPDSDLLKPLTPLRKELG